MGVAPLPALTLLFYICVLHARRLVLRRAVSRRARGMLRRRLGSKKVEPYERLCCVLLLMFLEKLEVARLVRACCGMWHGVRELPRSRSVSGVVVLCIFACGERVSWEMCVARCCWQLLFTWCPWSELCGRRRTVPS